MKKKIIILITILILLGILPIGIQAAEKEEGVKQISAPHVNENYYYTGKDIIVIPDHEGYIIEGKQGKNEGNYQVKLVLKENYIWDDGTTQPKTYSWNIIKKVVNISKKIKPGGSPSYVEITSEGKTLADAELTRGSIDVDGKIAWLFPESTVVEVNKDYSWIFTPSDLNRYEIISGRIVLFPKTQEEDTSESENQGGSVSDNTGNNSGNNSGNGANTGNNSTNNTGNNSSANKPNNTTSGNTTTQQGGSTSGNTTNNKPNSTVSNNTVSNNGTTSNPNVTVSDNTTKPSTSTSGNTTNKKQETVSDNRTEQEKLIDNIKDKTTASLTSNKTQKKEDIRLEIRSTFPEEKITKDLKEEGINSSEQISEILKNAIKSSNSGVTGNYSNLYDVSLIYTKDYGTTWKTGTKDNFPSNGYLKVSIPVPGQLDPDLYDFAVAHMFSNDDFGRLPGEIELPEVQERTDPYGIHYLDFYVTGLSPIMVSWEESEIAEMNRTGSDITEISSENINLSEEIQSEEVNEEKEGIKTSDLIKLIVICAGLLIILILTVWVAKKIAWG